MSQSKNKTRQETKQETREALIRAGMSLFSEQGVDLPSLDAICASAGFTRGAFYVHFKNRDDFLEAVVERVLFDFVQSVLASGSPGDDARVTVERFLDASARGKVPLIGQRRLLLQLMATSNERAESVQKRFGVLLEATLQHLAASIERGKEHGTVGTPVSSDLVALWLVSAAVGLTIVLDMGVQVSFDRVRASANELLRIAPR